MNAPRKNNNSQKSSSRNPMVSSMILSILDTLKSKPENKNKDEFQILKEFLDDYRIDWDKWLLEELSKQWNISFDMIKDDGFDIGQIIGDDRNTSASTLHNLLNSNQMWELGKDIEKVVIDKLLEEIKSKIPSALKSSFEQETNNTKTLWDLKRNIWNFIEYWNGWKAINQNLEEEIKSIMISNQNIVSGLSQDGKIWANDIAWNYKNWNVNHKKKFDKIITQEYLDGIKKSANYMEKNLNMLKDTFTSFVPNMWWIIDKYPRNKNEIDPEILQKIDDAQESWDKETSDKLSFYAYIELVQNKNKNLWDMLSKLFQNKFDFCKLDKKEQNELVKEMIDGRLEELKKAWIEWLLEVNQTDFDKFVKDIFDLNQNEITIPSAWWDIKLWVSKKMIWGENPSLVDLSNRYDPKLPIELDIKILDENKDIINNTALKYLFASEISDDGESIRLDWNNIGKLILLYAVWEASFDKKDMSKENIEKLEKLLEQVDQKNTIDKIDNENKEDIEKWDNWNQNKEDIEESKEKSKKEFLDSWKNIKWYEFVEDKINFGFKEGTRLRVRLWNTELPPADIWWDMRMQLEIKHVGDKDFKVKLTWWEKAATWFEWKEITYPRTKEAIENLSSACSGDIYKLPPPNEWGKSLDNVKNGNLINIKDGVWVFDEIKYENWKFISNIEKDDQNNWKEISYFGTDERVYEYSKDEKWGEDMKENTAPVFYKITHNNWKITVEYQNYKREMDYNNFIIFVSTKKLKPATKEHAEETKKNHDNDAKANLWKKWRQFFGVSNIISSIKWMWKKVNEAVKKYGEEKTEKFNDFLVGDVGIFQKLTSITSWIPWVWEAIQWVQLDYYNERDAKVRKKIEKWIKIFEWDPDFGTTFKTDWYLSPFLGGTSLKDMVINSKMPKDKHIAAATLIAMISKWKSPYRDLEWYKMKWMWIKLLLGEWHQKRFMEHQKELVREIENTKWLYGSGYDAQMTNDLVKAEMTYLINNIGWRATWQRFGQIVGDDDPKLMWSDKFAGELDSKYSERVWNSKVEEEYNKIKQVTNFTFALNEFKRFAWSGRTPTAFAFLKKMAVLAKSPSQINMLKRSIVWGMLSWLFLNFADKDTKWRLQDICRSMWFSPWLLVTRYEQKEKMSYILDYISNGDFSKSVVYNPNNYGIASQTPIKYNLFFGRPGDNKFESRRNKMNENMVSNGKGVEDFFKELPVKEDYKWKKISDDPILSELKWLSLESQVETTDKDVNTNSKVITDSPLTQTKWFVQRNMLNYKNWSFDWEVDQVQAAEDFWNGVNKKLSSGVGSKKELEDISKIFFNRFDREFDGNTKQDLIKRISTIKKYKWIIDNWKSERFRRDEAWREVSIWEIKQSDLKEIMWFNITWQILSEKQTSAPDALKGALDWFGELFWKNLNLIDNEFIGNVFGKDYVNFFDEKQSYELVPSEYFRTLRSRTSTDVNDKKEKELWTAFRDSSKWIYINTWILSMEDKLKRNWSLPPSVEFDNNPMRNQIYWR